MKVEKITLPLMATLFLSGNSIAMAAGNSSPLDPYAYIPAPTRAEKEAIMNKGKKKVKKLVVKEKAAPEPIQQARTPNKPASVIISESSPKFEDEKESKPAKTTTASAPSGDEGSGFLAGIKQSTSGIAKSTKAASSGMVNGTKAMGSKIAEGFKTTGEKMKESTAGVGEKMAVVPKKIGEGFKSTGEKVKEGSSSVGGKIASGFGALGAVPKAIGGAAGKVGSSTGENAKKLAAAPAAGFGAIGHGISKMNPFHKDDAPVATAQKPKAPAAAKPEPQQKDELQTAKAPVTENQETASATPDGADKVADTNVDASAEKVTPVAATPADAAPVAATPVKEAPAKVAVKPESKAKAQPEKIAKKEGGLKDRLASAPKAGIDATRAGLDATKASMGALSHGITKLNPFHKGAKVDQIVPPTTDQKPVEPKQSDAPAAASEVPQPQIGERIVPTDEDNAAPVKVAPTNDAVNAVGM